jgi:hypothetical protein
MGTLVDAIQDVIIAKPEAEAQHGTGQPDDGAIETQLTQEISDLWGTHVRLSASRKATAKELRQIRASLAERLSAMKSLLSRPGRGGQWRSWLRDRGIPRSTADRLVARHAETLCGHDENVPTGAISEPEDSPEKLATDMWPSLKRVLTTGESVVEFIGCIAKVSGVPHEWREIGLMIFHPVPVAADGLPGSAIASSPADPASQPSDVDPVNAEEPGEETPAAPPAAEDAAGVAAGGSGEMV